ncbi:MAG: lipoyl(octanoyl) transferase LipB [Anaerolineales bacterium]
MHERWIAKWLGVVDYEYAWRLQNNLADKIASGIRPPTLLLLEHPPTYTIGRRGNRENLLWDEAQLEQRGVSLHWVDRGGDITYHGPGQLVGYPLLRLGPVSAQASPLNDTHHLPQGDYIGYLRRLERALIVALAHLGVEGIQVKDLTGVWVRGKKNLKGQAEGQEIAKIAAIGVKVDSRGVSRHGFALNVNPDKSYWDGIIACGLKDYAAISLEDVLGIVPPMEQIIEAVLKGFRQAFGVHIDEIEDL